jgi:2,3-bisphosphoglycerate-dependent phosphoglycerate mutase
MSKLLLLRHGESQWNLENRFTGWVDIPLSLKGEEEARAAGEKLRAYRFHKGYTSVLQRAIKTLDIVLGITGQKDLPVERDQALNERHYGALQGKNKAEIGAQYGEAQLKIWRRSYDVPPPKDKSELNPEGVSESLKDTAARTLPYFQSKILPDVLVGKDVIVAAHGNSLRSIVMHLDNLTKEEVLELNIPTGAPLLYVYEGNKIVDHRYL